MDNQRYAGFWIRLGATLIDSIVLIMLLAVPLTLIYGSGYWVSPEPVKGVWDVLLQYVAPTLLTLWFWRRFMGTPGKMILKLRIVDADTGKPMTTPQAVGRYFAYFASMLPLMLGFVWIGIDRRKQGFHDKLAGTVVIRG